MSGFVPSSGLRRGNASMPQGKRPDYSPENNSAVPTVAFRPAFNRFRVSPASLAVAARWAQESPSCWQFWAGHLLGCAFLEGVLDVE